MASKKQIEANRRNSKKSTGPKSPAGKQVVSMNALTHGLQAEQVVIPGEDPEEFEAHLRDIEDDWQPLGMRERSLVERIAHTTWRIERLNAIEAAVMRWEHYYLQRERAREDMKRASEEMDRHRPAYYDGDDFYDWGIDNQSTDSEESVVRDEHDPIEGGEEAVRPGGAGYTDTVQECQETDEPDVSEEYTKALQAYEKAEEAFAKADDELHGPLCNRASVFRGSWVFLEKLSRYETTLERRLRSLTQELERLQTARKSEAAAKAPVIDVIDVDGDAA